MKPSGTGRSGQVKPTITPAFSFSSVKPATGHGAEGSPWTTLGTPAPTTLTTDLGRPVPGKGSAPNGFIGFDFSKFASPSVGATPPPATNLTIPINPLPVKGGPMFGVNGPANTNPAKTPSRDAQRQPDTVTSPNVSISGSADASTSTLAGKGVLRQSSLDEDPKTQECIEEFLRKSLLGEQLVNTQFHLFTTRSLPSSQITKPRVLCVNNTLLAKNSRYFSELLGSDTSSPDPSLVNLSENADVPNSARIDEYGYESDSDLEDYDEPIREETKDRSVALSSPFETGTLPKDVGQSKDGSGSVKSDTFLFGPEPLGEAGPHSVHNNNVGSVVSSKTAIHDTPDGILTAMHLRSLGSRRVLIKDTAFQTWYTLSNYLYTDKISFLPLGSASPGVRRQASTLSSLDRPRCSAKSMYRLACKVGLDQLRDEAFSYIRGNLTEHNILKELSSSILGKHPQLLNMELDVLYSCIASPPVVANFPAFARRIANKELAHGADIIVGIHTRLLRIPGPVGEGLKDDEVAR